MDEELKPLEAPVYRFRVREVGGSGVRAAGLRAPEPEPGSEGMLQAIVDQLAAENDPRSIWD